MANVTVERRTGDDASRHEVTSVNSNMANVYPAQSPLSQTWQVVVPIDLLPMKTACEKTAASFGHLRWENRQHDPSGLRLIWSKPVLAGHSSSIPADRRPSAQRGRQ